ncbi:MAG: hypothetical protein JST69_12430 [Bacteroidetes bacterium]|nr:hypothetical protein [Bacteroidota bacterium]
MKHTYLFLAALSVVALLSFSGCGKKGNEQPIQDKQLGLLSKTWTVSSVTLGGTDVTNSGGWNWSAFSLTISGTIGQGATGVYNYSCANRPNAGTNPWPSGGTWSYGASPASQINRDPSTTNLPMTYSVNSSGTVLQISFTLSPGAGWRTSNVSGNWVFNLKNP